MRATGVLLLLPDISWWGTLTRLNPLALYACLTSLQLRALLSAADDRDSSTDAIQKATCSLHIAHIGGTRGESAARAPSPIKKSRLMGGLLFPPVSRISQQNEEGKTPHFRFWYVHLIAIVIIIKKRPPGFFPPLLDMKIENNPAGPDSSQHDQILLKVGSFVAGAQQLVPHTQRCSRQWEEGRNEPETDAQRRGEERRGAHKGRARTGCDFSCLHPGARTVLCLHASPVMSKPSTLARRHVFGGGSGVGVGGIKKLFLCLNTRWAFERKTLM